MPNMWIAKPDTEDGEDKGKTLAESSQPNLRTRLGKKVKRGKMTAGPYVLQRVSTVRVDNKVLMKIMERPDKVTEYLNVEVLDTKNVTVDEDGTVRGRRGG